MILPCNVSAYANVGLFFLFPSAWKMGKCFVEKDQF